MKPRLLVLLQNPYKKGRLRDGWNPAVYRAELRHSHSGKRLAEAIPENLARIHYSNCAPQLLEDAKARGVLEPSHVARAIRRIRPDVILACGRMAQDAMRLVDVDVELITMPHPAYRALTKQQTRDTRRALEDALKECALHRRSPE